MTKNILSIKGLSKQFTISRKGLQSGHANVLNKLNLKVEKGRISTILGSNGAGKTTLFNMINGFEKTDEGSILFSTDAGTDTELTKLPPHRIAQLGVGRLLQGMSVFGQLTVHENLLMAARPRVHPFYLKSWSKPTESLSLLQEANSFFNKFSMDLQEIGHLKAGILSAAGQRLVALGMLYVSPASLLLLDEPCSGIQYDQLDNISMALRHLQNNGKTILLIEHNLEFVVQVSDICHYLNGGCIQLSGESRLVVERYKTEQAC